MDTLVLDAAYAPVRRTPWQKAIVAVVCDRVAEVVAEYPDREIHTPSWTVKMPSIIRLIKPIPHRRAVKFSRSGIYARDGGRCQYCGHSVSRADFEFEHVVPRAQGGKTCWENIVVGCTSCNQRKGNRTPQQARMMLRSTPVRPKKLSVERRAIEFHSGMPEAWRDFLRDAVYWNGELDSE